MRHAHFLALLGTVPALAGLRQPRPRRPTSPPAIVSHQLCSAAFVSRRRARGSSTARPSPPCWRPSASCWATRSIATRAEVTASFAGVAAGPRRRPRPAGLPGRCTARRPAPDALTPHTPAPALLPDDRRPRAVVEPTSRPSRPALDRTFAENAGPPYRNTKAVVVVRDGRVIAERYAPGYGIDTQVIGWSATKSVTNALIGILVRQGKLSLEGPAPIAAWADPKDPRHAISIDNHAAHEQRPRHRRVAHRPRLDRLRSLGPDGVRRARHGGLRREGVRSRSRPAHPRRGTTPTATRCCCPGSSATMPAATPASTLAFARRELFDKLGMRHVTLEFDADRHADRLQPHAGLGARLGALRPALSQRRRRRRRAPAARRAGSTIRRRRRRAASDYGYAAGFWTNRGRRRAAQQLPHRPRAFRPMPSWRAAPSASMS